jgi:hypothetical protein
MLYVGAIIEDSAFHAWFRKRHGPRRRDPRLGPTVGLAHLADLLRATHPKSAPQARCATAISQVQIHDHPERTVPSASPPHVPGTRADS